MHKPKQVEKRGTNMKKVSIVIPNYNGKTYLDTCLRAVYHQTLPDMDVIVVDNGSTDGSQNFIQDNYPQTRLIELDDNYGFCRAVNEGIQASDTDYVILLNNDTEAAPDFAAVLLKTMEQSPDIFSCAAKMLCFHHRDIIDDAGNLYCALGWAFARGKGKPADKFNRPQSIFAACAGAAIYRRDLFERVGLFDEAHFAYLEDVDIGYRARIMGFRNQYQPNAVVYHIGSATTGSRYNEFKVRYAARNSVYLAYKNMPLLQLLLNLPLLILGYLVKTAFFTSKKMGKEYLIGIKNGLSMCLKGQKVRFYWKNIPNYVKIQIELWVNIVRRLTS